VKCVEWDGNSLVAQSNVQTRLYTVPNVTLATKCGATYMRVYVFTVMHVLRGH